MLTIFVAATATYGRHLGFPVAFVVGNTYRRTHTVVFTVRQIMIIP